MSICNGHYVFTILIMNFNFNSFLWGRCGWLQYCLVLCLLILGLAIHETVTQKWRKWMKQTSTFSVRPNFFWNLVLTSFYQGNHIEWMSWLKTLFLFPPAQNGDNYSYLYLLGLMSLNYLIFAKHLESFELKVLSHGTKVQYNYNWNESF